MKLQITQEEAQMIMNYIASIPTGNIPLGEAIKITQILINLKPIEEEKDGDK